MAVVVMMVEEVVVVVVDVFFLREHHEHTGVRHLYVPRRTGAYPTQRPSDRGKRGQAKPCTQGGGAQGEDTTHCQLEG